MYCLSKFCRLCMKNDGILINFNSLDNNIIIFYHKFKTCDPDIFHDETSMNWLICETCNQNLTRSYEFREFCLSKDIIFNKYISQLKNSDQKNKPIKLMNLSVVIKDDPSLFNVHSQKNANDFDLTACNEKVKVEPYNDPDYDEDAFYTEEELSVNNESYNCLYEFVKLEYSEDIENGNIGYCNELNNKDNSVEISKKEFSDYETTCTDAVNIEDINNCKIHNRSLAEATPSGCNTNVERLKNEGSLIIQEDLRSGDKPYTCNVCFRHFSQKSNHKKHMQIHTEKKYVCNICNKGFNEISRFEKHSRTHTGEKSHVCDICNRGFSKMSHLKGHRRTHTGEKPYECKVCSKTFATKSACTTHSQRHTGEKLHICDICNRAFSQMCHLKVHRQTHTGKKPYECKLCSKTFARNSDRTRHNRIHTGEKPFFCDVCFKDFRDAGYLKIHKLIHTGEKPHVCKICNKRFNQSRNLSAHRKLHIKQ